MTDFPLTRRPPLRICVVTREFIGLSSPSETAAAITGVAQEMAAQGDSITVLFVPPLGSTQGREAELAEVRSYYSSYFLVSIEILTGSPHLLPSLSTNEKASLAVQHFLKLNAFDVVYFTLESGLGYYSLLGKELGTFASRLRMVVLAHRPLLWCAEADGFFLEDVAQVATAFMERYCVETADELICASESLRAWLVDRGFALPAKTVVLPDLRPREWIVAGDPVDRRGLPTEVVFFGETDYHHGLTLFCDAIDRLAAGSPRTFAVTLVGTFTRILGEHTGGLLLRRARRWPFELRLLTRQTPLEALDYIAHRNCLVVVPALAAVAPLALASCLEEGVPFVATRVGAIPEMIHPSDHEACLAEATPTALATAIEMALAAGNEPARPRMSRADKRQAWGSHLAATARSRAPTALPPKRRKGHQGSPLVSIVVAHHNRPELLLQAIGSVERQDYPRIELIVVDDGSTRPEALALLDRLEPIFAERGWRILREPNRYLGAARNAGVRASTGEFIVFLDDDNILFDRAVSTMVRAMEVSGSDICTCMSKLLYESVVPPDEQLGFIQYFPLGGSLDVGFIHNSFGDANAIMRRSVFERIGYLIEDYGFVAQDWELFARAALEGLKVRIIPEALYWYRSNPRSMYRSAHWYATRKAIFNLYRRYSFERFEHVHHLVLAQHVDSTDKEGYHHNLYFSLSDERLLKLKSMDVGSNEALELLAEVAAADGRADAAMILLGQRHRADLADRVKTQFSARQAAEPALAESMGLLTSERALSVADLRSFVVRTAKADEEPPFSYVGEPDSLYLQARRGAVSLAVLAAGCPAGVRSVTSVVAVDQAMPCRTEFLIGLAPVDADPGSAIESATAAGTQLLASSGWTAVAHPHEARTITARLAVPSDRPLSLIAGIRLAAEATQDVALGSFSHITEHRAISPGAVRRPRLGAPPHRQRARVLTADELRTARLVTNYPSRYPILKFVSAEEGIFLRPSERGIVVATLPWAFRPFARKVIASVEVAHEDASPFEFGMALSRPDEQVDWTGDVPKECLAFSGWLCVDEKFELRTLTVEMREITRTYLALNLAIRLPPGSHPIPSQSFWRRLIVAWDD